MSLKAPKISGIYKITNQINGHSYIGSAKHIYGRWSVHKSQLSKQKHHSPYLQHAVEKYGLENFKLEIVEECLITLLLEREQFYLDTLRPEYNINPIANSRLGAKLTEEQNKRNRDRQLGENGYWYGKVGPSKGRVQTSEEKEKRRISGQKAYSNYELKEKFKERMKLWWVERKKQQTNL